MNDRNVLDRIQELSDQERVLRERAGNDGLSVDEEKELQWIEVHLDQAWDLLRQRRALREFGEDPNAAAPRNPDTVEKYLQ